MDTDSTVKDLTALMWHPHKQALVYFHPTFWPTGSVRLGHWSPTGRWLDIVAKLLASADREVRVQAHELLHVIDGCSSDDFDLERRHSVHA